jgi:precorrin isomerase
MYNLAGKRGFVTIQTRYTSLADYERIDAEADKDEEYSNLLKSIVHATGDLPVDQFYRVIQNP